MPNTTSAVLVDNGYGTIGAALATGTTTLTFTTGHGARFPAVASGQVLMCCILNSNNILEEVAITLHAAGADSATMVRGQNGTTAKAWNAGDRIEARISSEVLKRLQAEAMKEIVLSTADNGATYTGSINPTGYGLVSGLVYTLTAAISNSGATPTINLSALGAVTVVLDGGAALVAGQMPKHGLYKYDGTNFILMNAAAKTTRTVLTSGTGATYTTPVGATRINVRMVGGGGGGGALATNAGANGTDTTFGTLTAAKGIGGGAGAGTGGAGGAGTNGDVNITGEAGQDGTSNSAGVAVRGGDGGGSVFGGAGKGGGNAAAGNNAATNSGSGGGGAGGSAAPTSSAAGGGAGGYVEKLITSPAATYTYTVGANGVGGAAGTLAGGDGAAGIIIIDEYYT